MPSDAGSDLAAQIDLLYRAPLGDFVARRNELSKRLRQTGDRERAAKVKALSKPSVSAWAVNQVFWTHRNEFERLREAGQRVRDAQEEGAAALREASRLRRAAVAASLRLAERVLLRGGHAAGPDILRRVETSLESLAALGRSQPDPPPGRLVEDVAPPGFEALAGLTISGGAGTSSAEPTPAPSRSHRKSMSEPRIEQVRVSLAKARSELDALRKRAAAAESARDRAREAAQEFVQKVVAAQQRWQDTVRQLDDAEERAVEAAKLAETTSSRLAESEAAVQALETELRRVSETA